MIVSTSKWRFVSFFFWVSFSSGSSRIIKNPVDTEVRVGQSVYINCSISPVDGGISWYHNSVGDGNTNQKYVYLNYQLMYPYNESFRIDRDNVTGTYNLVLLKAEIQYAGVYTCQNGEGENPVSAELVVFESHPFCSHNIRLKGLIGSNDCDFKKDTVHLSCSVDFKGNVKPNLRWIGVKDSSSFPLSDSLLSCSTSNARITCNYTSDDSVIDIDGAYFVCETGRSEENALKLCQTPAVKQFYAVGDKTPVEKTVNDTVECLAKTNLPDCKLTWKWSNGFEETTVSNTEKAIIRKPGRYHCEARCSLNHRRCHFDAMVVKASPAETVVVPTVIVHLEMGVIAVAVIITPVILGVLPIAIVVIALAVNFCTRKTSPIGCTRRNTSRSGETTKKDQQLQMSWNKQRETLNSKAPNQSSTFTQTTETHLLCLDA